MQQGKYPVVLTILFSALTVAHAQSLGDAAKANRDKDASSPKAAVVVTTDDLQNGSDSPVTRPAPNNLNSAKVQGKKPAVHPVKETVDLRVADAWRRKILEQKEKVQTLQSQIDHLNSLINPQGGAEFNGPPSRDRAKLMQRRADSQIQLDSQKRTLEAMQEEAREAGMHTATYDP